VKRRDHIIETRYAPLADVEVRQDGEVLEFRGHAAVFEQMTDLGPWRERIARGAFKKTAREADVRFLYNHEPDSVMARTKAGTLRLSEDTVGLATEADLDPNDWDVQRLAPKLRSGNVDQMSFAFRVVGKDGDEWDDSPEDGGKPIRTLRQLALYDVSAVTYPAYEQTDGGLRACIEAVAERRGIAVSWDEAEVSQDDAPETATDDDLAVRAEGEFFEEDAAEAEVEEAPAADAAEDADAEPEDEDARACGAARGLPLADKAREWDSGAARARLQSWAGGEEWSPAKYRRAFLYYDAEAPDLLGSYKLPFADVADGNLTAVPRAIYACASVLQGGRGGVDIPDADKATAKAVLNGYYTRLGETPPWESDAAPDAQEMREDDDTTTEDASAPHGDDAPAASEPDDGSATETPGTLDAAALWARLIALKNTLS